MRLGGGDLYLTSGDEVMLCFELVFVEKGGFLLGLEERGDFVGFEGEFIPRRWGDCGGILNK